MRHRGYNKNSLTCHIGESETGNSENMGKVKRAEK